MALAFVFVLHLSAGGVGAADELNFGNQLPRIPPRSPQDALRAFHVAEGFGIELVAAEPLVVDPVALSFDADGRMYVVEMRGYSEDPDLMLGRIRLLSDTDDDGRYDTSTVFASGLSWPTAVTCYDGGIYVAAAPDLIFFRDHDGDGVADERRVLFSGFGRDNVQGLVNSLTWSLDNRVHGATSSTGASLRSQTDTQHPPLELRGRDFALEPRSNRLEPASGGGQHGLSFNRWGEKFVCANSDHLQQILFEDRYLLDNPLMTPRPARVSIAADGPQADVFRSSPVEPWRIIRTQLRVSGVVPGPIEGGGTPAGYFTGATGVTIYRGDAWPAEYLDYALVCDVGSNLIHRKRLIDTGTRYRGERVDDHCEFITSDDIWFRPVQLANGPDGNIYIIDMCREVIEHPASLPPVIKRHLDLTSGRNRGRIYRIVPQGFAHRPGARLSGMSPAAWVDLLAHPNGWHRETAARLLYERNDATVAPLLRHVLSESERPEGRLHALYALQSLGSLSRDDLLRAFTDSEAHVRRHAIRLAESLAPGDAQLQQAMLALAHDPAAKVRYQLAFSLSFMPPSARRQAALVELARRAVPDADALAAVQTSLLDGAADVLGELARDVPFRDTQAGHGFLRSLANQLRRQANTNDLPSLRQLIQDLAEQPNELLPSLLLELTLPRGEEWVRQLRTSSVDEIIDRIIQQARDVALDSTAPTAARLQAIDQLALAEWDQLVDLYDTLLNASQPLPVQLAATEGLGRQSSPAVAEQMLASWDGFSPSLRQPIVQQLLSRPAWQAKLLDALEARQLNLQQLTASQQQQLARAAGAERWQALQRTLLVPADQQLDDTLATYRQAWQMPADAANGRQVFRTICASCHRLEGVGYELGPNLAAIQNRGAEAILLNVLDPNREVNPQYVAYTAITTDGRIFSGMIRGETATSVELVQADNRSQTLLRDEIDTLTSTSQSLMPTGLQKQVSPAAMNDLIGYLRSLAP